MSKKGKNAQAGDAAYGRALLCNRGGWTLREMLGSDFDESSRTSQGLVLQKASQSRAAKPKKKS